MLARLTAIAVAPLGGSAARGKCEYQYEELGT